MVSILYSSNVESYMSGGSVRAHLKQANELYRGTLIIKDSLGLIKYKLFYLVNEQYYMGP